MATITINGLTVSGRSVVINNNKVIVDGEEVSSGDSKKLDIVITGNVDNLQVDSGTVKVDGNVSQVATQSGSVTIGGDVRGSVSSMSGSVSVDGKVGGSVTTMSGSIRRGA